MKEIRLYEISTSVTLVLLLSSHCEKVSFSTISQRHQPLDAYKIELLQTQHNRLHCHIQGKVALLYCYIIKLNGN